LELTNLVECALSLKQSDLRQIGTQTILVQTALAASSKLFYQGAPVNCAANQNGAIDARR
jgi:hypothetical protein